MAQGKLQGPCVFLEDEVAHECVQRGRGEREGWGVLGGLARGHRCVQSDLATVGGWMGLCCGRVSSIGLGVYAEAGLARV